MKTGNPISVAPESSPVSHVQRVLSDLERATKAAFALLEELTAARSDGDDWTRLPRPGARCSVSHFSRSKVNALIAEDKIRAKTVAGGRYYSLADIRRMLVDAP
jgi:hypothetical protein